MSSVLLTRQKKRPFWSPRCPCLVFHSSCCPLPSRPDLLTAQKQGQGYSRTQYQDNSLHKNNVLLKHMIDIDSSHKVNVTPEHNNMIIILYVLFKHSFKFNVLLHKVKVNHLIKFKAGTLHQQQVNGLLQVEFGSPKI